MFNWLRRKKKPVDTRTETHTTSKSEQVTNYRHIDNPSIYYAKGVSGSEILAVTSFNPEMTLEMFKKVREEIREK